MRLLQHHSFAVVLLSGLCHRKCPLAGTIYNSNLCCRIAAVHTPTVNIWEARHRQVLEGSPGVVEQKPLKLGLGRGDSLNLSSVFPSPEALRVQVLGVRTSSL